MIKEEKVQRIVTETKKIWTCDICGNAACTKCLNCKKDICVNHTHEEDGSLDYPDYFCPECYKKYRIFKDFIEPKYQKMLEQEYETTMRIEAKS
jgi:hypothetical protein